MRVARSYIDTPWHHAARRPGIGIDCAGVLICAGRELGLVSETFEVPAYVPIPDGVSLLKWCDQYMTRVPFDAMRPGDAIVLVTSDHPQHLAIVGDYRHGMGFSIIHACSRSKPPRVIETRLMFSKIQRFVAAYSLPAMG